MRKAKKTEDIWVLGESIQEIVESWVGLVAGDFGL